LFTEASGGICEKFKPFPEGEQQVNKSLNTGIVTLINYGDDVAPRVSQRKWVSVKTVKVALKTITIIITILIDRIKLQYENCIIYLHQLFLHFIKSHSQTPIVG
jgi:hypothetical protein